MLYLAPTKAPSLLVAAAGAAVVACVLWSRPWLGIVGISFITASLVPRDLVTVAGFYGADLLLIAMLGLIAIRGIWAGSLIIPRWSIVSPITAFAIYAAFSALYAHFYQSVSWGLVIGELRPAVYAAGCALAVAAGVRKGHLALLLAGLFLVADMTAGMVLLQQFLGSHSGQVAMLKELWQIGPAGKGGEGLGMVRVVPPGHVLMYLMTNIAFCLALGPVRRVWMRVALLFEIAFLGIGLLLTYTRAQWIASLIALALASLLIPRAGKRKLGRTVSLAIPILGLCVGLIGNGLIPVQRVSFFEALADRASSVLTPGETLGTASLEWRAFEMAAAARSLRAHPVFGVGLGNDYRELTLVQGEAAGWLYDLNGPSRLTRFVHSSYMYLAVKMGLLGIAVFAWFCLAFVVRGVHAYVDTPPGQAKYVALACVCSFVGLLSWAAFEAHFMLPASMATVGLMVGLVAATSSSREAVTPSESAGLGVSPLTRQR